MKLKRMLSLTTALLMTASIAAGVAAPATAAVYDGYQGHTIAILDRETNAQTSSKKIAVNNSGEVASDTPVNLAIYLFNNEIIPVSTLTLPVNAYNEDGTFADEDYIEFSANSLGLTQGRAYGDKQEEPQFGIVEAMVYENGAVDPANLRKAGRAGVLTVANPNGIGPFANNYPLSPALDALDLGYMKSGNWVDVDPVDTYLSTFNVTVKAGTPSGVYRIDFDKSNNYDFLVANDTDDNSIYTSINFNGFVLYVGVDSPEPLEAPIVTVNDVGPIPITADDKNAVFVDGSGATQDSIVRNADGDLLDVSKGYKLVTVPVTVKNALDAQGLYFKYAISGPDADSVVMDINSRGVQLPNGRYGDAQNPVTQGDYELGMAEVSPLSVSGDKQNGVVILFKEIGDNDEVVEIADDSVIVNLNFIVSLAAGKEYYEFNVDLIDFEWSILLPNGAPDTATVGANGELLPNNSGNPHFTIVEEGVIKLGQESVVTTSTTRERRPGGGGGTTTNPDTGSNGILGAVATVAILGLAGGAIYFSKRKDEE